MSESDVHLAVRLSAIQGIRGIRSIRK